MAERFELVWAPNAIRDLDEIIDYVASAQSPENAECLYLKLVQRIDKLARFSRRSRLVPALRRMGVREYRELVVSPYRVLFRIARQTVAVLTVLDGRRDLSELVLRRALESLPFDDEH